MEEQLVDLLLSEAKGLIIVYNVLASLDERLISEDLLKQFFRCCINAFMEDRDNVTQIDDLITQFEDVARGVRPINSSKRNFLLLCKKTTSSITKDSTLYNVIEYGILRMFILKDSISAAGHEFIPSNPDPTDLTIEDSINQLNNISDKYRSGARLGGGFRRPFFWITLSLEREKMVNNSVKYADYIRDRLGLIHYKKDQNLIEIQIPGGIIIGHKNSRPTFIDAISHRRFRVLPDTQQARRRAGWGHTVDLAKFADQRDKIDGVPERVIESIDCNADLGLKFKYIGKITSSRGDSDEDNDEIFARRLNINSINNTTLKQNILRFIKDETNKKTTN